ncbi:uncharacterized protein CLAFUR5_07012 [Fulvia fulva]|uniref:Uncharacterized protein n=1 Tax=Passalora fulva TaxID=5499 RepID=A0A9Q8P9M3_PASFU|nr:uncharacterized protein CLAFUR5_07012 [Fulvia fulva]KAK4623495.1 hypothetical protein CLAFUR0_06879 [Fulvia fulva]UJO18419.1 hypothetical protein CLAFUR5_07012 [Fulvia fulva]
MSTLIMNPPPHRKPVPGGQPSFTMQTPKPPPAQNYPGSQLSQQERTHSRTRTSSSSVMPFSVNNYSPPRQPSVSPAYSMTQQSQHQQQQPPYPGQNRRTLSNATSSTSSTNTSANLQRVPTNSAHSTTSGVRRSTSSRSNSSISPTSYVALMRKQKGTVWCDRAQHEDPRILAAQRQAKMRAAAEVAGGHNYATQVRTSTSSSGMVGGVRSKIRHHGAAKASAYKATLHPGGAGVPMRLSASEVDDGNDSDEESSGKYHQRSGSGRSSVHSGRRGQSHNTSGLSHSRSNGSTPPQASPVDSMGELREEETPTANGGNDEYFAHDEDSFGTVAGLPKTNGPTAEERAHRNTADDLRRRGSVDDRTMTMSNTRLFIANPDADLSD